METACMETLLLHTVCCCTLDATECAAVLLLWPPLMRAPGTVWRGACMHVWCKVEARVMCACASTSSQFHASKNTSRDDIELEHRLVVPICTCLALPMCTVFVGYCEQNAWCGCEPVGSQSVGKGNNSVDAALLVVDKTSCSPVTSSSQVMVVHKHAACNQHICTDCCTNEAQEAAKHTKHKHTPTR